MSRKARFSDSFWGTDFCSTAGYEAIKKRIKEGRATCKALEDFLRARAKAEDEYSKAIQRTSRPLQDTQELGSLRAALDCLKAQSERIAGMHSEANSTMLDAASRMASFVERQKVERKPKEDAVLKSSRDKVALYKKTVDAKRVYELRSQEAEEATSAYQRAKPNESTYTTKDWDRIVKTQAKCVGEAQRANQSYQELVDKLDQCRLEWEHDMTEFCQTCEMLEEARIKMLQNEVWIYCNLVSSTCVENDEHCEGVRRVLERVDTESDLQSFMQKASTGSERPAAVRFEKYQQSSNQVTSHAGPGRSRLPTDTLTPGVGGPRGAGAPSSGAIPRVMVAPSGGLPLPHGGRTVFTTTPAQQTRQPPSQPLYLANRSYNP